MADWPALKENTAVAETGWALLLEKGKRVAEEEDTKEEGKL